MEESDSDREGVLGIVEEECDSVNFVLGEKFSSYEQLKEKITAYQQGNRNNVQLAYTDSRTLDAARKRAPKRIQKANENLHYYSLHLTCNLGSTAKDLARDLVTGIATKWSKLI